MPPDGQPWANQPNLHNCLQWTNIVEHEVREELCNRTRDAHRDQARRCGERQLNSFAFSFKFQKFLESTVQVGMLSTSRQMAMISIAEIRLISLFEPFSTLSTWLMRGIRFGGAGVFQGNTLLPIGHQIPVTLVDYILEPVHLHDDGMISLIGKVDVVDGNGAAFFYMNVSQSGTYHVSMKVSGCTSGTEDSWFLRSASSSLVHVPVTVEQGWVEASEAFEFSKSSIFAIELRGREPNCKVSHIYFRTGKSRRCCGL